MRLYKDTELESEFGRPGDWSNFRKLDLPYPMRIAWDLNKTVNTLWCHKKIINQLHCVFEDLLTVYGLEKLQELGIDLFAGCYNYRKMRGSRTKWSRHSWAIAIDLDSARNALRTKAPLAQFSKPEYRPMMQIFEKHGFINYGVAKGFDYMHFEIAKL